MLFHVPSEISFSYLFPTAPAALFLSRATTWALWVLGCTICLNLIMVGGCFKATRKLLENVDVISVLFSTYLCILHILELQMRRKNVKSLIFVLN